MNNIIKRKWNQNSMVIIEDLQGMAFQAESGGHTFQISGIDGEGNTVVLSGTPAGVMLRADGQDVALTCSVSGGVVSATLPANAYSVPGRFGLTIFLTSDGQKTAIYAAVGTVGKTSSGTVAPPAGSDVVDLVNAIATAVATIPASYTDLMASVAPTYSSSGLYAVGSYAWYNGKLYRCTTAITSGETWTSGHWTLANLGSDLVDLKSAFACNTDIFNRNAELAGNILHMYAKRLPGMMCNDAGGKFYPTASADDVCYVVPVKQSTSYYFTFAKKITLLGSDMSTMVDIMRSNLYGIVTTADSYYAAFSFNTASYPEETYVFYEEGSYSTEESKLIIDTLRLSKSGEKYLTTNIYQGGWQVGDLSSVTGEPVVYANTLRSADYCPVYPSNTYILTIESLAKRANIAAVYQYDKNKTFLGSSAFITAQNGVPFTVASTCEYIKFVLGSGYGTTDKNDVNLYQNGGLVRNVVDMANIKKYKTVNLYQAGWELGDINTSGVPVSGSTTLRSKDYCPVYSDEKYMISVDSLAKGETAGFVYQYMKNKNFFGGAIIVAKNGIPFSLISGCALVKFVLPSSYGTTYKNDFIFYQNGGLARNVVELITEKWNENSHVIVVDKNGNGDYTKVMWAVRAAVDGDVIFVRRGTYNDEEIEAWSKNITIIGESPYNTIIQNETNAYATPPIEMSVGTLYNLTFRAKEHESVKGAYALHIDDDHQQDGTFYAENCIFISEAGPAAVGSGNRREHRSVYKNCIFENGGNREAFFGNESTNDQAAGVENNQYFQFYNCTFKNHGTWPVVVMRGMKSDGSTVWCTFVDCAFMDDGTNPHPIFRMDYSSSQYLGPSTEMGTMGLINWNLDTISFGNTIPFLNACKEGEMAYYGPVS